MPILRTDTMHLLDAPHMAATLLARSEDIRTPVETTSDLDVTPAAEWRMPLTDLLQLKAKLLAYIDVEGVVTAGLGNSVCFWAVDMLLEHADGTRVQLNTVCFSEAPVASTGIRLMEFSVSQALETAPLPGDHLVFSLTTSGIYAPGASVDLLAGTLEHDSSLTIEGLQLPVDTQTLL